MFVLGIRIKFFQLTFRAFPSYKNSSNYFIHTFPLNIHFLSPLIIRQQSKSTKDFRNLMIISRSISHVNDIASLVEINQLYNLIHTEQFHPHPKTLRAPV